MRFLFRFGFTLLFFLLAGMPRLSLGQDYTITVSAGAFDRTETIVSFSFPDKVESGIYRLKSEGSNPVYLQVTTHNRGWFILDDLRAGQSRTYSMIAKPVSVISSVSGVSYAIDQQKIAFTTGNRPVLSYFIGSNTPPEPLGKQYKRGGYIHPVYSPDGVVLTNHLDPQMHPHHYGIWSAWTHTEFQGRTPDFWNVQDSTGRVNHADSLEMKWNGPVCGGFKAKNYFVDLSAPTPVIALNEEWKVQVYNTTESDYNMFDLQVTQTANTGKPLILPKYRYGGIAFRGNAEWDDPDRVSVLTSEGYDRSNGNATRARWVDMEGMVDGKRAGITVFGHPDNYRAPQPVRIHPEIPYFVYAPTELGRMTITAGEPYKARYRYITHDGKVAPETLNRLWNDYAYPPGVTIVGH